MTVDGLFSRALEPPGRMHVRGSRDGYFAANLLALMAGLGACTRWPSISQGDVAPLTLGDTRLLGAFQPPDAARCQIPRRTDGELPCANFVWAQLDSVSRSMLAIE